MDYLDFEIWIGPGEGGTYPVHVMRAPDDARPQATMALPFDERTLAAHLMTLRLAMERSESTRRPVMRDMEVQEPDEQVSAREFGRVLFDAVLPDEVRACYKRSLKAAKEGGRGLRLRLHIEAPDLAVLPWEFLYDENERSFVCLSNETPVVRYLQVDHRRAAIEVDPPLRVLGMIAAPEGPDVPPLNVAREKQRIEEALAPLKQRITLEWLEGQTWWHLQEAMRRGPWHVFHFIGHGGFDAQSGEGTLVFAKEDGRPHHLSAAKVGTLLVDHHPLRLAVLNACRGAESSADDIFSSTASRLILGGIPAVVAMQYKISDRAAIEFSRGFYASLADGLPVDASVSEARKSVNLSMDYTVEWGTPVLHMQSSDGRLFDINATAAPPPAATPLPKAAVEVVAASDSPRSNPSPAAATSGGRWKVIAGVVGALLGLFFLIDVLNGPDSGDESSLSDSDAEEEAILDEVDQAQSDVEPGPEALQIITDSELEEWADDGMLQGVAEKLVALRIAPGESGTTETEVIWSLSENDPFLWPLSVEEGWHYEVIGVCDENCVNFTLELYESNGETPIEREDDVTFDDGAEPRLRVTPPSGDTYNLKVELFDCKMLECYVGIGVYAYESENEAAEDTE